MLRWAVQTCALSCRWRIKELSNWRPASTFWFTSALPEHTHTRARTNTYTHTNTHTVGHFSVRLCDFSTHVIQAWQRMSGCLPAITHLRRENQQWPRKTRRADWSQIGTRPPNQRDMPGHIVELNGPITAPGLTISQRGHNERPPYLCLIKKKKKVWTRLHDNNKKQHKPTHNHHHRHSQL